MRPSRELAASARPSARRRRSSSRRFGQFAFACSCRVGCADLALFDRGIDVDGAFEIVEETEM